MRATLLGRLPSIRPLRTLLGPLGLVSMWLMGASVDASSPFSSTTVSSGTPSIALRRTVPTHLPSIDARRIVATSASAGPAVTDETLPEIGQSVGTPGSGSLFGGTRLQRRDAVFVRNPVATYGTTTMVGHINQVADRMRSAFPQLHPLLVGDLSTQVGGPLGGHFSHQSGRDVDLAPYYRKRGPGFPRRFAPVNHDNLHYEATFALIEALADTADHEGGVEWILLDYGVQRALVGWARSHGVSERRLEALFQYPRGPRAPVGIVRHMPEHRNHLHVRFQCAASDTFCASPPYPPTRASRLAQRD